MVLENKQLLHFSEGWRKAKILFIKNKKKGFIKQSHFN